MEDINKYLESCKELSLTARMAIALIVFEKFCSDNNLELNLANEMSDYLWQWPLIDGPDQFELWESSRPELVNYGLGDSASDKLISVLNKSRIDETQFRKMVEGVIEILWGSFWGAAEHELSMKALGAVLLTSNISELPVLTPFKFSRFTDNHGWGQRLNLEDRDFWRNCFKAL